MTVADMLEMYYNNSFGGEKFAKSNCQVTTKVTKPANTFGINVYIYKQFEIYIFYFIHTCLEKENALKF